MLTFVVNLEDVSEEASEEVNDLSNSKAEINEGIRLFLMVYKSIFNLK